MGELFLSLSNYSIYKNGNYYICVSNKMINNYQMFIGFTGKDLASLGNVDIVDEIKKVSNLLFSRSDDIIYVLPVLNPLELERAASINDDREYNRILEKILPITNDVYQKFMSMGKRINDVIGMIRQTDVDQKIIHWIDMKLMAVAHKDCIQEVDFNNLVNYRNMELFSQMPNQPFYDGNADSGGPSMNQDYSGLSNEKQNVLVKKLVKPKHTPTGFSSMKFIVMILSILFLFGVAVVAWIL